MNDVIPIGRYKGQPLEALAADPEYTQWLVAQRPRSIPPPQELLRLTRRVARGFHLSRPAWLDLEELESMGSIGLAEAVRDFDPANGGSFENYATRKIKGRIIDQLRVITHFRSRYPVRFTSWPFYSDEEGRVRPIDFADRRVAPDSTDVKTSEFFGWACKPLGTKPRAVIQLYYRHGLNMKEIAEVLGISESRVCQLHAKALAELRDRIEVQNACDKEDPPPAR